MRPIDQNAMVFPAGQDFLKLSSVWRKSTDTAEAKHRVGSWRENPMMIPN